MLNETEVTVVVDSLVLGTMMDDVMVVVTMYLLGLYFVLVMVNKLDTLETTVIVIGLTTVTSTVVK